MAVRSSADEMDVQALVWLVNMSSNPSTESIVIESMSALPLKSVDSFKRGIDHTDVPLACTEALECLLRAPAVPMHESKVDRLIRATVCFGKYCTTLGAPQLAKACSPTLYTGLLSIHPSTRGEIRELVLSNLIASDDDLTALRLEPIIWAHLLRRVSSSNSNLNTQVMQMLYTEIPSFYWKADYVQPITYALDTFEMKIPSESDNGEVTLRMAIQRTLYIYVAEVILHRHMRFEYTFSRQNDYDVKYLRFHLLFHMAGSRSMRTMAAESHSLRSVSDTSFSDTESLFSTILQRIGDLVDIASPHKDNDNRGTVLEFLYTLITSVEFDDHLTLLKQSFALTMFFRVLNPHPLTHHASRKIGACRNWPLNLSKSL